MKVFQLCTPILFLTTFLPVSTDQNDALSQNKPFEGILEIKIRDEGENQTDRYYLKENRLRCEESLKKDVAIVLDLSKKTQFFLMMKGKMALELSSQIQELLQKDDKPKKSVEIQETQKTEIIAGFSCRQWFVKSDENVIEMWLAESFKDHIGTFYAFKKLSFEKDGKSIFLFREWKDDAAAKGLFPFRIVEKNAKGKELRRLDVMKASKKTLEDSMFEVPSGFKTAKMDVSGKEQD